MNQQVRKPAPGEWIVVNDGYKKKLIRWNVGKEIPTWWAPWTADKSQEQKELLR